MGVGTYFTSLVALILQFDGSIRYPNDPGFPTSTLGRLASCAVCIKMDEQLKVDKETTSVNDRNGIIMLLGGKTVEADTQTTSGEIEYESLLFGLTKLYSLLTENENDSALSLGLRGGSLITVEGDCKNVIMQMNDDARPRKLENLHRSCKDLVNKMSMYTFVFRHIPRENNHICDSLAKEIIFSQQDCAMRLLKNEIEYDGVEDSANNKLDILDVVKKHFGYNGVNSFIPFSWRPSIYRHVVEMCNISQDYPIILEVGNLLQIEAQKVWSQAQIQHQHPTQAPAVTAKKVKDAFVDTSGYFSLLEEAYLYQIYALESLGRRKEARDRSEILCRKIGKPIDFLIQITTENIEAVKQQSVFFKPSLEEIKTRGNNDQVLDCLSESTRQELYEVLKNATKMHGKFDFWFYVDR